MKRTQDASANWWSSYFDDDYLLEHQPMFGEARTRREAARALDIAGLPLGARILDVPCGQGRHAALFRDAGLDVTGLDHSAHLLAAARKRLGKTVKLIEGDIRELPRSMNARFDAVISLGASFGFFATPQEDEAAIASYARVLRDDGTLVLHAPNRDGIVARFIEKDWWEAADGTLVLHERELDPLSGLLTVRRILRDRGATRRSAYRLRLYTATELAAMCARHDLIVTEVFDGWRDRPLRRTSGEMLVTARKV